VTADVVLADPKVSREHARLECHGSACTVVDLGSANGTWLNGVRVQKGTLAPGDTLALGGFAVRFEPGQGAFEPDVTRVDSEADLEMTLARSAVEMTLSNTGLPRLTVYTPVRTWEVPLTEDSLLIGRDLSADIVLDDPKVSRRHARVERRGDEFVIRDLGSTNGIWRAGDRVDEYPLAEGEAVRIGKAQLLFKPGIKPDDLTIMDARAPLSALPRPPVVVVPGVMGSQLWLGSERVWPNVRLLLSNSELLRWPGKAPLEARGILDEVVVVPNFVKLEQYGRLCDYLEEALGYERGRDLLEFAYDWRQDVRVSARQLAATIDQLNPGAPITLIAHSLGCMVSRYYVECAGGKRKVGRLLLLGGPHLGTPKSLTGIYVGLGGLFGLLGDQLRQVASTFPSTYQVMPTYPCAVDARGQPFDLLAEPSWMEDWQLPLLEEGRAFRRELGNRSSVPAVSIFGYGQRTITGLTFRAAGADPGPGAAAPGSSTRQRAELTTDLNGDGSVPNESGVLAGSEIHPVLQTHGALYVDSDVKMRLKLELTRQNGKR
jgi:pSer/pThr/pTyr-binding forkhead associated (FHA) protein